MKYTPGRLLEGGAGYIKAHPQLLATILLIIVIPVAFLVSGQQFLSAARENQERLEKDRVGIIHDLFASYLGAVNFDATRVQNELDLLALQNPDITKLQVLREVGSDIQIIASLEQTEINTIVTEPDTYRVGNFSPNETIIIPYANGGIRYWQSFKLIRNENSSDYYIFIETSLEHIDTLLASRIIHAYMWLIGLLVIIFFLLLRHVKLIDYMYLYAETKKANETKDLFTNMIAHELRAPLTAMRGYASMIRERDGVDEITKKNALEIESASGRLVTIISDLLDVARIQSGKLQIEKGDIHVSGVLRSIVEALHPSADEKQIKLIIDDSKGNVEISGDEKRFYQALTNVVSNAIKYTKEGTITLSLTDFGDRIELRVKDTGMGISSADREKLFAPYARVGGAETASITGTGLGMWITKQLIEIMGGSIGIESIKGVGTHVVITLPKTGLS